MRPTLSNMLLALAVAGWVQSAVCSESYCATGQISPIKLRVTVQPERRQDFIKFLQSDKEPIALGANYVGRAETSDSLSIDFLQIFVAKRASKTNNGARYRYSGGRCQFLVGRPGERPF